MKIRRIREYSRKIPSGAFQDLRAHTRASPSGRKSGCKYFRVAPESERIASAARYPLRTAPSIVDGQPVAVQSPAKYKPDNGLFCAGRHWSDPGAGENVAHISLTT